MRGRVKDSTFTSLACFTLHSAERHPLTPPHPPVAHQRLWDLWDLVLYNSGLPHQTQLHNPIERTLR